MNRLTNLTLDLRNNSINNDLLLKVVKVITKMNNLTEL
jgi:hypothetical protein